MFIVASVQNRKRVREQLLRPASRRLDLGEKARFLPCEAVEESDRFFASSSSGVSVALISGKAEVLS